VNESDVITSPLEAALARLWSRILEVNDVDRNDDFLLLGGDRAGLAALIASVNSLFRVDLKIESLPQDAMTVAGMARAIVAIRSHAAADKQSATRPTVISRRQEGEAPHLSAMQRRMWFLARLFPDDPIYNQSRAYRLVGEVDVDTLDRSARYIARRHEILRTSYSLVNDEPRPIINEDVAVEMKRADLSEVPSSQQNETLQALLLSEMQRSFELEAGPPWRMLLVYLSRREHVLLRVAHHIVSDGWTSGIFERELSVVYSAFVLGLEPRLPVLPVQYADYAAWQRESLQGKAFEAQLNYWRTQLAGLSKLDLPTDRPRPPVASYRGANLTVDLPAPLVAALKGIGRQDGTTLFMKLVAIFQVLLYRYSGQENIAVGMPIAGRKRTELEGLLGFFANTLVLRTDLSGSPSFRELLARVRGTALDAYTHQDVPFEKLVEELAPERDMSRNPLFQVMFVLQNVPDAALEMEGLKVSSLPLESHSAKFDLTLSVRESAQGFQTDWEYASDLFDAVTVKRMAQHFERLLEAVVADPDRRISELPILTEAEKHQLLVEWNDTDAEYPRDKCVHELFGNQAEKTPDAVAVLFENQQLTYRELNQRANQLGHYLRKLEVGPETLVGMCVERSLEMIIGLLGILKAGGAYVPLDPSYPKERLEFMLQDAKLGVLLTQKELFEVLSQDTARIIYLDTDWAEVSKESDENPTAQMTAESLAYVIYTSGSTGRPKGVQITHRALVNFSTSTCATFALRPTDRVLQFASLSFDGATEEIFSTLLTGATLVLRTDSMLESLSSFWQQCHDWQITILNLPTAFWHELTAKLSSDPVPLPSRLRLLVIGGQRASPEHLLQWQRYSRGGVRLLNEYGPTEATVVATSQDLTEFVQDADSLTEVPIGRPISNVQVYILDAYRNPVPIRAVGEIYIGGDGVSRGYLNQPKLTAEKFIIHSFDDEPAKRLYKTGDLARYLPDGNIEFLGRMDNQVKIRGYRIELEEIETVLRQHPAIQEAVVLAREESPGDKRLVAYVVTGGNQVEINALRDFLKQKLPDYMVPSAFVLLAAWPLTPNGKVDRQVLPAPNQSGPDLENAFVAARTAVEKVLAKVWGDILKVERVGIYDNFFELGGHSLLAMQVISRINRALRVESPLRTLFERPTIAGWVMTMDQDSDLRARAERRAQLFLKVDQLSDDQVAKMLDQKRSAYSQQIT
jgi:amino acid adenylation domain-containing protein